MFIQLHRKSNNVSESWLFIWIPIVHYGDIILYGKGDIPKLNKFLNSWHFSSGQKGNLKNHTYKVIQNVIQPIIPGTSFIATFVIYIYSGDHWKSFLLHCSKKFYYNVD